MTYYHNGDDQLTNGDVEQDDRFDELTMRGLYESPHLESDCLGMRLENAGELMIAARRESEYDEFGLEIEGSGNYELDAYWVGASLRTTEGRDVDPIDLADEDLTGLPLEAQERLHGLREERKRQREKALAAHVVGIERETRCRGELVEEREERRSKRNERVLGEGIIHNNAFENIDDEAGAVREAAARIEDHLITGPGDEVLRHLIARKVRSGQDVYTAQSNTLDQLYQEAGVIQPISSVPIIPSKYNVEADIQGEVTTLWQPKSRSQQQVGLIKDDAGDTIKFTVWTRSRQGVILHEGDLVRIRAGKVGKYQGQATLAADSETRIEVLERGDGPAPRGDIPNVDWEKYAKRHREQGIEYPFQRHGACTIPALGAPGVEEVSRPVHAPIDRLDQEKGDRLDALEWLKATEIFDEADSKIPLPIWWREQANVVSIIVDVDADGEDIGAAIREAVSTSRAESTPVPETPVPPGKRRLWALIRNLDLFGTALEDDVNEEWETEVEEETETAVDTDASELTGVATPDASETTVASDDRPGLGLPTTTCRCPECAHDRAQYRLVQLRSIDEPPTRLLSCVSCGQRWREDS
ncbi:hypothetical protein [Halorarius halobius]|uniref:hypothetical protein n=1 Tax=Halorarius halobius TaxID=2962671 RepID=UPI0020CB6F48|nr:hypothetical protein [Halorarius halobius]